MIQPQENSNPEQLGQVWKQYVFHTLEHRDLQFIMDTRTGLKIIEHKILNLKKHFQNWTKYEKKDDYFGFRSFDPL